MSVDLGSGFSLRYTSWSPDRSIRENARRYFGVPDQDKIGAILTCRHGVEGVIHFHTPADVAFPNIEKWTVESWEPLTLSPSIDCGCCHGYIRQGKWEDA